MHTARTNIGDHCRNAWGELLLHIEIPLHHVSAFGTRVGIGRAHRFAGKLDVQAAKVKEGVGQPWGAHTFVKSLVLRTV